MDLSSRLSERIHIGDIYEILYYVKGNDSRMQELYNLIYCGDERVSYQALWVCSHFDEDGNRWLALRQNEIIDGALACMHSGKRRIFLNLIYNQPQADPPRVDFLDFCLERMIACLEPAGVQSLCMKLAYGMCRNIPELLHELRTIMDIMEPEMLSPAMRSARKNVLKAMEAGKSLG